jgi:uncharacterized protein YodC (DUF2158 family)
MSHESNFKVGNVVQLKSGGPDMTVSYIVNSNVVCQWFDYPQHQERRLHEGTFTHHTLKLGPENDPPQESSEVSLQTGDLCMIKSGGPQMTVSLFRDSMVVCQWFYSGLLRERSFKHETLSHVALKHTGLHFEEARLMAGDVVQLKSGGPDMTVGHIADSKLVCQWFYCGCDPLREGIFIHGTLLSPAELVRIQQEEENRLRREARELNEFEDCPDAADYADF